MHNYMNETLSSLIVCNLGSLPIVLPNSKCLLYLEFSKSGLPWPSESLCIITAYLPFDEHRAIPVVFPSDIHTVAACGSELRDVTQRLLHVVL